MQWVKAWWLLVKVTHRHPVNIAMHLVGVTCYAGAATFGLFLSHEFGNLVPAALFVVGLAMFLSGHAIKGNLGSTTPILAFRLVRRKFRRNQAADRGRFLRR